MKKLLMMRNSSMLTTLNIAVLAVLVLMFMFTGVSIFAVSPEKDFTYKTASTLGIPSTLSYTTDYKDIADLTTFEVNGFKYSRNAGSNTLTSASLPDEPANCTTLVIQSKIGSFSFSGNSHYNNIDFTKYTNVKNLIIEDAVSMALGYKLQELPKLENVFILCESMPFTMPHSTLKNVVLCYGLGWETWNSNINFNLGGYKEGVNLVTIESYKYIYYNQLEYYKKSPNYKTTDNYKITVIPDSDLPLPKAKLLSGTQTLPGYKEYSGIYYIPTRENIDMFPKYKVSAVDARVTKAVIDPSKIDKFNGFFITPNHKLDTLHVTTANYSEVYNMKAKTLIIPMSATFKYTNFENFESVYFLYDEDVTTVTISGSIPTNNTIKFYVPLDAEEAFTSVLNNPSLSETVKTYNEKITPTFEIEVDGEKEATTDLAKTIKDLEEALEARLKTSSDTDKDKEKDNILDDFTEKLKEDKTLQVIVGSISVILGLALIYFIYKLLRKVFKWVK